MIVDEIAAADPKLAAIVNRSVIVKLPFRLIERVTVDDEDGSGGWTELAWMKTDFKQFFPSNYEWCRAPMPRMLLVGNSSSEIGFLAVEKISGAALEGWNKVSSAMVGHTPQHDCFEFVVVRLIVQLDGKVGNGYPGLIRFGICRVGTVWIPPKLPKLQVGTTLEQEAPEMIADPLPADLTNPFPLRISSAVLVAFALMNCSNIRLQEESISEQAQAKRLKRGKLPLVRYHVLKILERSRKARLGAPSGMDLALHWVRGHFKEYGGERGLFGKHRGIYWWSHHLHGRAKDRVVLKDYTIPSSPSIH